MEQKIANILEEAIHSARAHTSSVAALLDYDVHLENMSEDEQDHLKAMRRDAEQAYSLAVGLVQQMRDYKKYYAKK
jgi:L-ribulose-5-phosphate 3-epimerase UlaE